MEINWKNLITRTISGAVLVLLIVCAVVFGTVSVYSKILFGVLFSFIMVVCQKEFLNITTKENASINIFLSNFDAYSMYFFSSSSLFALLIPTLEPELDGFTNIGKV